MTQLINTLDKPKARPQRKAFTSRGRQFAWDSVSLGAAKKCLRFYYLTIVEGWQPKLENVHLKFGILFHSALEYLDHVRVQREWEDTDLIFILRKTMADAGTYTEEGFKPWTALHDKKNLESLVRSIIWYFDHYRKDSLRPLRLSDGRAAVELSFRFPLPLPEVDGEKILYCGHLDELGEYGGQKYWVDRKTTGGGLSAKFAAQFSPSVQMGGYSFAARMIYGAPLAGGLIDAMQVGAGFSRFGRFPLHMTEGQLEEWLTGAMYTIQDVHRAHERNFWPMNETACSMYDGCSMQGICSRDPSVRDRFLESGYERREWDPLEPRGV